MNMIDNLPHQKLLVLECQVQDNKPNLQLETSLIKTRSLQGICRIINFRVRGLGKR